MSRSLEIRESGIAGCLILQAPAFRDERGVFVKTFQWQAYENAGLAVDFVEQFYTVSEENVLRGMHCQLPPHGHDKLVYCVSGSVFDAVVDLRAGSPSYGRYEVFELSAQDRQVLYIPEGVAHGFCVLDSPATLVYSVTSGHSPSHDSGIRWDSAGIEWPIESPIISARDRALPRLNEFASPFRYRASGGAS